MERLLSGGDHFGTVCLFSPSLSAFIYSCFLLVCAVGDGRVQGSGSMRRSTLGSPIAPTAHLTRESPERMLKEACLITAHLNSASSEGVF